MSARSEQIVLDFLSRTADAAHGAMRSDERVRFIARLRASIEEQRRVAGAVEPDEVRQVLASFGDPKALVERELRRLDEAKAPDAAGNGTAAPDAAQRAARPAGARGAVAGKAELRGSEAGRSAAGHGSAGQGSFAHGSAGQGSAGQGSAGQDSPGHGSAGQGSAGQDSPAHGSAGQRSAAHGSAGKGSAGRGSAGKGAAGKGAAGKGAAGKGAVAPDPVPRGSVAKGAVPAGGAADGAVPNSQVPIGRTPAGAVPGGAGQRRAMAHGAARQGAAAAPAAAQAAFDPVTFARRFARESLALLLLGLGGLLLPIPLWLIGALIGVTSRVWSRADKFTGIAGPLIVTVAGVGVIGALNKNPSIPVDLHAYVAAAHADASLLMRIGAALGAAYLAARLAGGRANRRISSADWRRNRIGRR